MVDKVDPFWFKYDKNFSDQGKLKLIKKLFGPVGLGLYLIALEQLLQSKNLIKKDELIEILDIEDHLEHIDSQQLVAKCLTYGLLVAVNDGQLYSPLIDQILSKNEYISQVRANAGRDGGLASKRAANAYQNQTSVLKEEDKIIDLNNIEKIIMEGKNLDDYFSDLYAIYPKKAKHNEAKQIFYRIISEETDIVNVFRALTLYLIEIKQPDFDQKYIKNLDTFLASYTKHLPVMDYDATTGKIINLR